MKSTLITITVLVCFVLVSGSQSSAAQHKDIQEKLARLSQIYEVATFAGGCFWCTESDFEKVNGVIDAISGYTGGHDTAPSYKSVSSGKTGHTEAVQVFYDPGIVTYEQLLDVFWRHINPTDAGGQFVDRGSQYRPEIFYHNAQQEKLARASKKNLEATRLFDEPIATPITRFETFYPAESYHQDYYKKNAIRYKYYRWGSGRDQFLDRYWKDGKIMDKSEVNNIESSMDNEKEWIKPEPNRIKATLTPLQYQVTQENGTEPPFKNEYWDNKQEGIYVDIVSGEPLFSSKDKFKSGTGWPSFTRPLETSNIIEKTDKSFFMVRTEVRSRYGDSHLGHLFDDGPKPTGLRYCINSAALRFIPKQALEKEGYSEYSKLFSP